MRRECYQIINDEGALKSFIDWLPDLLDNEIYYVSLFARKKYCPELIDTNDKTQLKRFVSTKERLFDKIRQLELPIGAWKLKDTVAPQESLVLYIMPNPRSMYRAMLLMGEKCWKLLKATNYNIHAEAMSCIQKSKSRTCFVDFDIDDKGVDLRELQEVTPEGYTILETRGGYHVLIQPSVANKAIEEANAEEGQVPYKTNWHSKMLEIFPEIDNTGDQMIPVPGCVQGGFTPKFIEL